MISHLLSWPPVLLSFLPIALYIPSFLASMFICLENHCFCLTFVLLFHHLCFIICVFIPFFVLHLCFSSSLRTHLHSPSRIASSVLGCGCFSLTGQNLSPVDLDCLHALGLYLVIIMLKLYFMLFVINSVTPPFFNLNQPKKLLCMKLNLQHLSRVWIEN